MLYTFFNYKEVELFERKIDSEVPDVIKYFDISVVIDVLRATSTIITALSNGATCVIPVSDIAQALSLKYYNPGYLLGGERGGQKIEGFDLGNSPFEYDEKTVKEKTVILTTTNGTSSILSASRIAQKVLLASFLNLSSVVNMLSGYDAYTNIAIICAGNNGEASYEDIQVAGAIIFGIVRKRSHRLSDSSIIALKLWESLKRPDFSGEHAHRLRELGFEKDLEFCQMIDHFRLIAKFENGKIVKIG
ncbi:2-phosphosulfolactate phosphatase [Fervidobacterium changbaicum]|uniref:Probable 2-phosphosulfolactate phosphatase n=1 Tax=Fervidobacterium islandicum TaxID=2423 RepID=A0AAI8CL55_FERIS|nr:MULTISPECIES: 2-phosphosulfolactate phosphatase [Fervidobacterium]AMW32350.1 2-phosphosulfolactate phosphatase [Fervidobacterium islandicum]SDH23223.1 2-phosphosulfolactate phosphatase [Fervidobacterium changbaicum]